MNGWTIICLAILFAVVAAAAMAARIVGAHVGERKQSMQTKAATDAIQVATAWQQVQANEFKLDLQKQQLALGAAEGEKVPEMEMPEPVQQVLTKAEWTVDSYNRALRNHKKDPHLYDRPALTPEIEQAMRDLQMMGKRQS